MTLVRHMASVDHTTDTDYFAVDDQMMSVS